MRAKRLAPVIALAVFLSLTGVSWSQENSAPAGASAVVESGAAGTGRADTVSGTGAATRPQVDGLLMAGGTVYSIKGGKRSPLAREVTLSNGTRIAKDGTVTLANGTTQNLREGQLIGMDGRPSGDSGGSGAVSGGGATISAGSKGQTNAGAGRTQDDGALDDGATGRTSEKPR